MITSNVTGAEVIPFIQVWMMLPAALLGAAIFTRLLDHVSQEKMFYLVVGGFLAFFSLFVFVLYPLRDLLHPHATADYYLTVVPRRFHGFVEMLRNWSFSAFYVACELWAAMVTSLLFWGFANEITRIQDAKNCYGFFTMGGNFGATAAGLVPYTLSFASPESNLYLLMAVILVAGAGILWIYYWINKSYLAGEEYASLRQVGTKEDKAKLKLSFSEGLKQLGKSRYLVCIAVMVVGYNLVLNLGELLWKEQLREVYPDFHTYNTYLGYATTAVGLLSLVLAYSIPKMISGMGWTKTMLICPVVLLISGLGFFGFQCFRDYLPLSVATVTAIAIFCGTAMNTLGRATKHSVFDATKDMAYIPLDHDVKLKGKAAIDAVGSRFGRSGSAVIHQGLLMTFASISASAPVIGVVVIGIIVAWIYAGKSLGRQFHSLLAQKGEKLGDRDEKCEAPVSAKAAAA